MHEDGRLKKCFTTSKFNMNFVAKNKFFFSPGNNIMQSMTDRHSDFVHVLYNNGKILGPDESTDYNHSL